MERPCETPKAQYAHLKSEGYTQLASGYPQVTQ